MNTVQRHWTPSRSRPLVGLLVLAVLSACLGLLGAPAATAQAVGAARSTVVDVTDFGADPGGHADSAPAVKAALRHAKTVKGPVRVVFPRGTYQVYPESAEVRELYVSNTVGADQRYRDKSIGLLIEDMRDVVVDGRGSTLLFHGLQTAFASIRSHNVTFTGFTFDYVAPKVIDATVRTAGVENGHAYRILSVPADSPYTVADNKVTWLGETSLVTGQPYWSGVNGLEYTQITDPVAQRSWRGDNPLFSDVTSMSDLGGQRIRIDYATSSKPSDQGLVYQMRQIEREQPGAFIWESSNVTVRNLVARELQTFGLVGQFSENITIDRVDFSPDPDSGRATAGFADFIQMSGIKGKVSITNCVFDGPHDDPINIHGTYLQVAAQPSANSLTVSYKHPQTAGFPQFYVGDTVELVDSATMRPLPGGTAKVTAVDGPSGQDHDTSLTDMTITLDRPVPSGVKIGGTVVENTTYTPSVRIAGNIFRNVPTRGILVTTRKPVVIENNRFERTTMAAIYISADAYQWYESGAVSDVLIRRNTFVSSTGPVIFVEPTNQVLNAAEPVHRGIRIERNTFEVGDVTVVDAKSVGGLSFTDNVIRRAAGATTPYSSRLYVFRGSDDVLIEGNRYAGGLNARADTVSMDASSVTVRADAARVNEDNVLPVRDR